MMSVAMVGFVLGLQHALEPDHLAGVSTLLANKTGVRRLTAYGAIWGLGHMSTLVLVGGLVLFNGLQLNDRLTGSFALAAGGMLIGLGLNVLYRLWEDHLHGGEGLGGEGHGGESGNALLYTSHRHGVSFPKEHDSTAHMHDVHPLRPFAVGIMHGLAGSGAMVVLALAAAGTKMSALAFLLLFGAGSVIGMAAMSLFIAVPLTYTAHALAGANSCMRACASVFSIITGFLVLAGTLPQIFN